VPFIEHEAIPRLFVKVVARLSRLLVRGHHYVKRFALFFFEVVKRADNNPTKVVGFKFVYPSLND